MLRVTSGYRGAGAALGRGRGGARAGPGRRSGGALVRRFYALDLPRGEIGVTLGVAVLGAAILAGFWAISGARRAGA
jgi:hypothetical protein